MKMLSSSDLKLFGSIWWSFMWRSFLYSFVPLFILGAVDGFVRYKTNDQFPDYYKAIFYIVAFSLGLISQIFALKTTLSKKHDGFSVRFIKDSD